LKYFAGVDTHKERHAIAVVDEVGKELEAFSIPASTAGYVSAMDLAAKYAGLIWGVEGTGSYGRPFADALVRAGHSVFEVPGKLTKRYRGREKSDERDAHAIAEALLREGDKLPRHLEADAEEATRLLYERRDRNVREQTAKINRIRALALRLELALPADLSSVRAVDTVKRTLLKRPTYGYTDFQVVDEIGDLLSDLRLIAKRIAELERRMRPFVKRLVPKLLELRGCSIISAAGLVGHTGSILNYSSADAFAAHAGAAPVKCSSGKYDSVRVCTGGNRQLNRCLHNIANTQLRTPSHAGEIYYQRKRSEGKSHREAMRCLKRRLASVVFRILREEQSRRQRAPIPALTQAAA
jgi:transposase